jgi:hypothetical protein
VTVAPGGGEEGGLDWRLLMIVNVGPWLQPAVVTSASDVSTASTNHLASARSCASASDFLREHGVTPCRQHREGFCSSLTILGAATQGSI